MANFTDIFGGNNIAPSDPTYLSLVMAADVTLQWPVETAMSGLVVSNITDVNATAPGLNINLPDATLASNGFVGLFNNIGAQTVSVRNSAGGVILSLASGTVWQIYLADNSTAAGVWRAFQFGASVSVAVAAALAGAGLKAISNQLAERMVVVAQAANYILVDSDRAKVQQWTSGVGQFTLPSPAAVGSDWFASAKNSGSGNLTIVPTAGTIDGNATVTIAPGSSAMFITDGNNFFTLFTGGGGSGSGFNYITINAAGSGNLVLAGAQLNQIGYRFTGVLTGNRHIIVPNTAQQYWVDNETTGAFTFDVATAGQVAPAPVIIPQGNQSILQCDGTNVIPGVSTSVAFPISVANGGTGATTAANARTNLGATSVGNAVFTAASVAAAQASLSVPPNSRLVSTGSGLLGGGDLSADRTHTLDTLNSTGTYTVKPADTARASTTVLANDPDLTVALAQGHVFEVEIHVLWSGASSGAFSGSVNSTGITLPAISYVAFTSNSGVALGGFNVGALSGLMNGAGVPSLGNDGSWRVKLLVNTPAAPGTVTLSWAQNNSFATPTVVKAGSYIRVRQLN